MSVFEIANKPKPMQKTMNFLMAFGLFACTTEPPKTVGNVSPPLQSTTQIEQAQPISNETATISAQPKSENPIKKTVKKGVSENAKIPAKTEVAAAEKAVVLKADSISKSVEKTAEPTISYDAWDALLSKYVANGKVNYKGLKSDKATLEDWLKTLAENPPKEIGRASCRERV